MESICASPKASSLIESLRDIGYSLESALADIVGYRITAKAKNIDIFFELDSNNSAIAICQFATAFRTRQKTVANFWSKLNQSELNDLSILLFQSQMR